MKDDAAAAVKDKVAEQDAVAHEVEAVAVSGAGLRSGASAKE